MFYGYYKPCDIVYHFKHLCDRVMVLTRSEELSFRDLKNQGKIQGV